jgi:predicted Zn finger-like uncharacterized protein
MSFATRCTSCGTIFRVVVDQLKVSDGWVRCGRCHAVFNAEQGLFDLEHDAPPAWDEPAAADDTPATEAPEQSFSSRDQALPEPSDEWTAPLGAGAAARASLESTPAFADDRTPLPSERQEPAFDMAATRLEGAFTAQREHIDGPELLEPMTDSASAPGFVLQAQRKERWQSMPVRLMLGLLSLLLVLGLATQTTQHFRNLIAAQWPMARPGLIRYCEWAGCSVEPLRHLASVRIDSSALNAVERTDAPEALTLTVTLKNQGSLPVAMPAVDLTLSGTDGEVISRRTLLPTDFNAAPLQLAPETDAPLQVHLAVDGPKVSGYTVEVFYP